MMDLRGRIAACGVDRHHPRPSSTDLAMFEFLGEGSQEARLRCIHCGFFKIAHEYEHGRIYREPHPATIGHKFEPIGAQEYDRYYCGHSGWD